jgi:hypothetical protein
MRSQSGSSGTGTAVVGEALAAFLGILMGGPVGGVVGAAAARPMVELVRKAWREMIEFRETNVEILVARAAVHSRMEPEQILAAGLRDPDVRRLMQTSLLAAAEALDREKLEGLARCLANGLEDRARVDEEALFVRSLADLDPIHIRVLAALDRRPMTPADVHRFIAGDAYSTAPDLSGPVLTVLERNGLTDLGPAPQKAPDGEDYYGLSGRAFEPLPPTPDELRQFACTDFGRACLERLGYSPQRTRRQQ